LHQFLASATGDDCYVGAGLIFKPGKMLPNKSHFLNKNMIDEIPSKEGLTFIANQGKLTVIPQAFLRG